MTECISDSSEPSSSRRDVLQSAAGVGAFGLFGDVFDRFTDDLVSVNIGYRDSSALDAAALASDVIRTYAWGAATISVPKWTISSTSMQTLPNDDG